MTESSGVSGVRIGCSGWNYGDWRTSVYSGRPTREWLAIYSGVFRTVEVNSTFYGLPRPETVARWIGSTDDGFSFSVKVSRYLTHVRQLRDVGPGLERLLLLLQPMIEAGRLDALLWQLPPNLARDDRTLTGWLASIPPDLPHAVEFRHQSWFCQAVYDRLYAAGIALVEADDRRRPPWPSHPPTGPFRYLRMHYGDESTGGYSAGALAHVAAGLAETRRRPALVYFNNDWDALAVTDAASLYALMVGRTPTPVGAPLGSTAERAATSNRLLRPRPGSGGGSYSRQLPRSVR